jgi:hypothetical protein
MTTATAFDSTSFQLDDYWADPVAPTDNEIVVEAKKNTKYYACIDPVMLMTFIASCLEQDLITDKNIEGMNPDKLLANFREPGHPVYAIIQGLLGISLLTASRALKNLLVHMKESNVEFDLATYDHAYRCAESMKEVYKLEELDEAAIRQVSLKADYIRHNQFLKYDEESYRELVAEVDYLFMTSNAKFVVVVNQEVEDNLSYISTIKPGLLHYNTYATAQIMPFVIMYLDSYGKVPYNVAEFSDFVKQKLLAMYAKK